MIFIIILASIIGFVINVLFWVWVYRLIFGSGRSSGFGTGGGSYYNTGSDLYNMVNYNDLMAFQNSLQQLENQIHSQANDYSMDEDFQKFYKLIQKSSMNAAGGKVKIDPSLNAKMNDRYFKMMNQMRENDRLRSMKSDAFQSSLYSQAASVGIDPGSLNF